MRSLYVTAPVVLAVLAWLAPGEVRADAGKVAHARTRTPPDRHAPPGPASTPRTLKLALPGTERRPIVRFEMRGDTKVRERTASFLARTEIGDLVCIEDIPELEQAFVSSELFEEVAVSLENERDGYVVVATVRDKHSWVIAPTVFVLGGQRSFGLGFAENNLAGLNQKLLLYGQYGDRDSLFFGTYLDPSVRGTPLTYRFDLYAYRRINSEFLNPVDDPSDRTIARRSTATFLNAGALLGWRFNWWLQTDLRLRGAYVMFEDAEAPDGTPLPLPEKDGWDVTAQYRLTVDARQYRFGVRWGPFVQLYLETSIPGLDDYDYSVALLRAYHAWRLLEEHQLELRVIGNVGRQLPFHEEISLGGASDLRGYSVAQFRGDVRTLFRAEYSVPITKWKFFAFRALGFWDSGYAGLHFPTTRPERDYLPSHADGIGWWRNNVGAGLRVYIKAVVLPLLGFDVAYGLERGAPDFYFQLGITDF